MGTIAESAKAYEPKKILTIAELEFVELSEKVLENDEAEHPYSYIVREGDQYKVPNQVLKVLKVLIKEKPELKKFKVLKEGEGIKTSYTTIPL
jgi:hypothetical protein